MFESVDYNWLIIGFIILIGIVFICLTGLSGFWVNYY